jgi:membrane associated rhomboid family serine protease
LRPPGAPAAGAVGRRGHAESDMGIYDREYYRKEGPSFLDAIVRRGTVCKWLIGVNVAFFVIQLMTQTVIRDPWTGQRFTYSPFTQALVLNVQDVLNGQVWRLLTYAFLHDPQSIWHIVFNMLFLWWFGSDLEDLYGPREFLVFYLAAALVGGVAFVATSFAGHSGAVRLAPNCLGASGAVMAVLVLCAFHYPRRIIYLFFLLPIPIWVFVVGYVALDAFTLLSRQQTTVAVSVHLGGALFGFVYYKLQWRLTGWLPDLRGLRRRVSRPRLRLYREEEPQTPVAVGITTAPPPPELDKLRAEMDAILEKISRVGKENITQHERDVLLRASELLRRRRS